MSANRLWPWSRTKDLTIHMGIGFTDKLCLKGARSSYLRRLNNEAIVPYIK